MSVCAGAATECSLPIGRLKAAGVSTAGIPVQEQSRQVQHDNLAQVKLGNATSNGRSLGHRLTAMLVLQHVALMSNITQAS